VLAAQESQAVMLELAASPEEQGYTQLQVPMLMTGRAVPFVALALPELGTQPAQVAYRQGVGQEPMVVVALRVVLVE